MYVRTDDNARGFPCVARRREATAAMTNASTWRVPTAEEPRRLPILVMQFHAPSMRRRRTRVSSGGLKRTRPHVRHTRSDDVGRIIEVEGQMMGNVTPGGVHEARFATTGVGPPIRAGRLVRLPGS
eukprot:3306121-Pleurochrysis_carterae.AAC.1